MQNTDVQVSNQDTGSLGTMVGGNHYKAGVIQPVEFLMKNPQLDFCQVNMVKYAYRHRDKKHTEDLLKIVHYAMLASKFNYDEEEDFLERIYNLIGGDEIHDRLRKQTLSSSSYILDTGPSQRVVLYGATTSFGATVASGEQDVRDGGEHVPVSDERSVSS